MGQEEKVKVRNNGILTYLEEKSEEGACVCYKIILHSILHAENLMHFKLSGFYTQTTYMDLVTQADVHAAVWC